MSDRNVTVRLKAEIGQYKSAMADAAAATGKAAGAMDQAGAKAQGLAAKQRAHSAEWATLGTAATVAGAAITAGVAGITKSAMSWESAWTGVKKTVDGTPEQLSAVEDGLRGLARELPASHEEIAGVAEAAGQLGVKTGDVVAFTKTMIDMGESTNLTADEAATSIARFTNIMGTVGEIGSSAYSRVGSAMVELGNNFATTEAEITSMSLRLAGAGQQVGMTEGDVLGLAAAMSSVGIEAEAGGTAMSQGMKKIDKAVRDGGDSLDGFAKIAGKSAEEFANQWRDHPAAAMDEFVQGLGRVQEQGGSVSQALEELGIKGIREQDTFLRLAGASDILTEALKTGNEAFDENKALAEEASKRYETAESKIRIAWNSIKDAAITAGAAILPVVASVADGVATVAGVFADLPAPITGTLTVMAGIAGVALLGVGGLMKLAAAVTATKTAMEVLGLEVPRLTGNLGTLGGALGLAAGAFAAVAGGAALSRRFGSDGIAADRLAKALQSTGNAAQQVDQQFANAEWTEHNFWSGSVEGVEGVADAMVHLSNLDWNESFSAWGNDLLGFNDATNLLKDDLEKLDQQMATLVTGGSLPQVQDAFKSWAEDLKRNGQDVTAMATEHMPQLVQAMKDLGEQYDVTLSDQEAVSALMGDMPPKLEEAASGSEELGDAMSTLGEEAGEAAQSLSEIVDSLQVLGEINMTAAEATGAFHEAQRALTETLAETGVQLAENGRTFDVTTEAGYKAQQAFDSLARSGWDMAEATAEAGGSLTEIQGNLQGTYDGLVGTATQFGLTGAEAEALARHVMGIPEDVSIDSWMSEQARTIAEATGAAVDAIPEEKWVTITAEDQGSVEAIQAKIDELHGTEPQVLVTDQGTVQLTQEQINAIMGKTTKIAVTDDGTVLQTQGKIDGVTDGDAVIHVDDNGSIRVVQGGINEVKDGSAKVHVSDGGTINSVQTAINRITGKSVTINVSRVETITTLKSSKGTHGQGPLRGGWTGGSVSGIASGSEGFPVYGLAGGGRIPGRRPADPTFDDRWATVTDTGQVIRVQSSEFIVNSAATQKNLDLLRWLNAGGVLDPDMLGIRGLARGGIIRYEDGSTMSLAEYKRIKEIKRRGYATRSDGSRVSAADHFAGERAKIMARYAAEDKARKAQKITRAGRAHTASSDIGGQVAAAVASAISRYQPVVRIGGREFYGVMQQARRTYGARA